jgi:cell division protein FtsB
MPCNSLLEQGEQGMTDDQFERIKKGLNFHSEGGVYNLCTLTETTLRTIIEDAVKFYEKQQKIDALHIMELQKQKGELTDKVKELEAQIEKMQEKLKTDLIANLKENMQYSTSPSCTKGMELFIRSIEKWEMK